VGDGAEDALEDLDRLATAAYLAGREGESFDLWARGYQQCSEVGETARAARFGAHLALALGFKGDIARARGWTERARRMLDDANLDCVELGYLEHLGALGRIFEEGDIVGARAGFARAVKIGERFGDRGLLTLAHLGEGRCLIYLGEIGEGMALLDEAMISVESGELAPMVVGDAYCTVIDACRELFDVHRCEVWTDSFNRWCETQPDPVPYRGHCRLHQAQVLQIQGAWSDAVSAAEEACARLAEPLNLLTIGGAHYVRAELYRLRGELQPAERAYEEANELECEPQPGLALLRCAQGRLDVADAAIRRVLDQSDGVVARARVLSPFVEIVIARGDARSGRAGADELAEIASTLGSAYLRAQAAHAAGAVLIAEGEPRQALVSLRAAARMWVELRAPYETARTRALIGDACRAVGDDDGAQFELRAAQSAFEKLGALSDLVRLASPISTSTRDAPLPGNLTPREVDVLVLVAQGKSNREIADLLFISERTVATHISHILTKLDVPSRTAATAYAYEHKLV